jgi:hypothetical protein
MYNRMDDEWDDLIAAGNRFLVERARLGKVTSYTELNTVLHQRTGHPAFDFGDQSDRAAMGYLLGRIVDATWDPEKRVMLSALVHYLGENDAGPGFYALAADKGLIPRGASRDAKLEFWVGQLKRLHQEYAYSRPQG